MLKHLLLLIMERGRKSRCLAKKYILNAFELLQNSFNSHICVTVGIQTVKYECKLV